MKTVHCDSIDELNAIIEGIGPDALYRGQVKHYERDDGSPSLTTSFARTRCIPNLMIKWHHYARQILRMYVRGRNDVPDLPTDQAILQHYGWRSFFLDATGDARVAAWFASNQYLTERTIDLVEDCFEDPVFLVSELAFFKKSKTVGHLYAFSRKLLRQSGVNAVHLSEIATNEGSPRYVRQDAYMVGPIADNGLTVDCLSYHITAPSDVLAAYAGELSSDVLFPDRHDDPILNELLSMPWEKIQESPAGIDYFRRSLPLPEYHRHIVKHMPPTSAMYRPFWLKDFPQDPNDTASISYILCSPGMYYGSSQLNFSLPHLTELLSKSDGILVEAQGLVYHGMGSVYGKGILVMKRAANLVIVSEIGVEHPGLQVGQIGKFPGLHYSVDELGTWHFAEHPENCDCGSDHNDHIRLLGRVDMELADGTFMRLDEKVYVAHGVDPHSDTSAITQDDR